MARFLPTRAPLFIFTSLRHCYPADQVPLRSLRHMAVVASVAVVVASVVVVVVMMAVAAVMAVVVAGKGRGRF
jgi:hypothetical protein